MKNSIALQIISIYLLQSSVLSVCPNPHFGTANGSFPLEYPFDTPRPLPGTTKAEDLPPLKNKEEWEKDCLYTHNFYRRQYRDKITGQNVGALEWDAGLVASAQVAADQNCEILKPGVGLGAEHHTNTPYGENMAGVSGYGWMNDYTCSPGVDRYHKEEEKYQNKIDNVPDGETYGFSGDIGHYTQLLWPDSRKIGCGFCITDSTPKQKVEICHYDPP